MRSSSIRIVSAKRARSSGVSVVFFLFFPTDEHLQDHVELAVGVPDATDDSGDVVGIDMRLHVRSVAQTSAATQDVRTGLGRLRRRARLRLRLLANALDLLSCAQLVADPLGD